MSVPNENSTFCETCSSYNLVNAILIDGIFYCETCIESKKIKLPKWINREKQK